MNIILCACVCLQTSWETVGKKKPLVKEGPSESKENKENREKKGDKEGNKGRSASSRRGKGRSRQGTPAPQNPAFTPHYSRQR